MYSDSNANMVLKILQIHINKLNVNSNKNREFMNILELVIFNSISMFFISTSEPKLNCVNQRSNVYEGTVAIPLWLLRNRELAEMVKNLEQEKERMITHPTSFFSLAKKENIVPTARIPVKQLKNFCSNTTICISQNEATPPHKHKFENFQIYKKYMNVELGNSFKFYTYQLSIEKKLPWCDSIINIFQLHDYLAEKTGSSTKYGT